MAKLYRSRTDKKVSGLCGGLAEMLNVDATLLRLVVIVTTFFTWGSVILLYIIATIVIPKEPGFGPPNDPYGHPYGRAGNVTGQWGRQDFSDRGPSYKQGPSPTNDYKANDIDEMMKDIEKKAMKKEIDELRARVAQYEKSQNHNNHKGDV